MLLLGFTPPLHCFECWLGTAPLLLPQDTLLLCCCNFSFLSCHPEGICCCAQEQGSNLYLHTTGIVVDFGRVFAVVKVTYILLLQWGTEAGFFEKVGRTIRYLRDKKLFLYKKQRSMRRWPFVLLFPFASWAWNVFQHVSGLIQLCYYYGITCVTVC